MLQTIDIFGLQIGLYDFFNILSAVVLAVYFCSRIRGFLAICPHARKSKQPVLIGIAEIAAIGVPFVLLFLFLNPHFGKWFTHGNANYYGNLTAFLLAFTIIPVLLKISPLKAQDLFSPGLPISLFVAKLACFFHGCCSGFEVPKSWYFNQNTGRHEFPVQLVEAMVALALFFGVLWYKKRNKIPGSVFPFYLILYSSLRFCTEFLRRDFPNKVGPFDAYQIMSFAFLVIGLLLLYEVWISWKDIEAYFDRFLVADPEIKKEITQKDSAKTNNNASEE